MKLKPILKEALQTPYVVIDTSDNNKVVGAASNRKAAERLIVTSELPPMSVPDKTKLKVVKVKKKQIAGWPLQEAEYELYHKAFTSASKAAYNLAIKRGYTIDEDDWFSAVATGFRRGRPSVGKTNSFHVKLQKNGKDARQMLHFQVYGRESGTYELNAYVS